MVKKHLLVIDLGVSKTVIISEQFNKPDTLAENIYGSGNLLVNNGLNIDYLNEMVLQNINKYGSTKNYAGSEVILSLPGSIIDFKREQVQTKKFNKNRVRDNITKLNKNKKYFYIEPIINEPDNGMVEIWLPYIDRKLNDKLQENFKQLKLSLKKIYYPLSFFSVYADKQNYLLLNMGGNTTELLFYQNHNLQSIKKINIGGDTVINDLVAVLKISRDEARRKLFAFNGLFDSYLDRNKEDILSQVIDARIKELFNFIKQQLNFLPAVVYIFGGLANMAKIDKYLEQYLRTKVINLNKTVEKYSFITHQAYLMRESYLEN